MFWKNIRYTIVAGAVLLALTACGNSPAGENSGAGSENTAEESSQPQENLEQQTQTQGNPEQTQAETQQEQQSEAHGGVATSSDMAEVIDVVEEGMTPVTADSLNDGEYEVTAASSSTMFKIDSAVLNVADGEMTAVMTMGGTGYLCLYMGTAEEAAAAGGKGEIPYQEDSEGRHTFTIPVEALDQGIACAAYSKRKELWYDRTLLFRSDSLKAADGSGAEPFKADAFATVESLGLSDGYYSVEVTLSGGSGKASVESPTQLLVKKGKAYARITWGSSHYDYMIVNGDKYEPVNEEGNSAFLIPVGYFDRNLAVVADTTAMSKPYEIEYTLYFDSSTLKEES